MGSSFLLRAAAAPERFLTRGFARWMSRRTQKETVHRRPRHASKAKKKSARSDAAKKSIEAIDLGVELPRDLRTFLDAVGNTTVGDYVPRASVTSFTALLAAKQHARLRALLAGAVPFGGARGGALWVYMLADESSPAHRAVAHLDPKDDGAEVTSRSIASFALSCVIKADGSGAVLPPPNIAAQEAVRAAFERARSLEALLVGSDARARSAAKALARRPLDVPPAPITRRGKAKQDRTSPLALGTLFETFFREDDREVIAHLAAHAASTDAIVREAVAVMSAALERPTSARAKDLARRRRLALRAASAERAPVTAPRTAQLDRTRAIVAHIDANPMPADAAGPSAAREETLLALSELGDRSIVPVLVARAITGDVSAVDMLGALNDRSAVVHLAGLLERDPRARPLTTAVVRALSALDARDAAPALRRTLELNPMTNWREGLERTVLVQALVSALGQLEDQEAASMLMSILESTSLEYRAVLPTAAWALGRIRHAPALVTLERLLCSPKETVTCEALWAVGAIGAAHEETRVRAAALLESLPPLEPGADLTRLAALAKMKKGGARPIDLRRAIDKALWEPAFRQEETSRRRMWTFRAIADLDRAACGDLTVSVLRHETVRHFVTRDDHRVRRAAEEAFQAWGVTVPTTRKYFSFVLDDLERRVGLEGLHDAIRDPLGVFRHNVATRIAERGDPTSARPLAEATARLFSEPPTSTYEYDDAPPHLVAFVRALAKLNCSEGNDVLIEGLRSGNHQVRAVIAENAPDDERIVPELMAMLGDPRSFLRSRAERSLTSLGAIEPSDPALNATTEGATVRGLV